MRRLAATTLWPAGRPQLGRLMLAIPAVLSVLASARLPGQDVPTARVRGVVYDSIAHAPIAGVTVHYVGLGQPPAGSSFSAVSDSSGRYTIESLPAGRYVAGFFHRAIDTLGIELPQQLVDVPPGNQQVPLATPSASTLVQMICPADQRSDSTGTLIGHVRSADVMLSVAEARVDVEWSETVIDRGGVRQRDVRVAGGTTGPGWFAICDLPSEVVLYARASHGADSSGYVEVELPPGGLRHLSLTVGTGTHVVGTETGMSLRGRARLSGTATDAQGRPVSGAHVLVWGTGLEATTGERGTYAIDSLPGGTYTVEARTLGFVPRRTVVHLSPVAPATASFTFSEKAVVLPAVTTRATLVYSRKLMEFERRRRSGRGTFLTSADIEARPNTRLSTLLQDVDGVEVRPGKGGLWQVYMKYLGGGGTTLCIPTLYVDGLEELSGDFNIFLSDRIAAVEIYPRAFNRPAEFTDENKCGAIVMWTRPHSARAPRR